MPAPASSVSQRGHASGSRPAANSGHTETPASSAATVKQAAGGYILVAPGVPPAVLHERSPRSRTANASRAPRRRAARRWPPARPTARSPAASIMTGTAACTASRAAWRRCRPRWPRRRRRRGWRPAPRRPRCGISGSRRAMHAQPVGLPERDQPHARRHEVGGEGLHERLRRRGQRQAVRGRAGADRNRIGDLRARRPPAPPAPACGHTAWVAVEEGRALRQRLQPPLGRGREGGGQLGRPRPSSFASPAATARQASASRIASVRPAPCASTSSIQPPSVSASRDLARPRPPIPARASS